MPSYVFAQRGLAPEYDRSLAWTALLLVATGLVMVYSASIATAESSRFTGGNSAYFLVRQSVFLGVAILAATLTFIGGLDAARFEDSGQREVVLRPGTPKERRIGGQAYLMAYGLPQFFFHVTTAYDLLRHNGVEIGKKDFMGAY